MNAALENPSKNTAVGFKRSSDQKATFPDSGRVLNMWSFRSLSWPQLSFIPGFSLDSMLDHRSKIACEALTLAIQVERSLAFKEACCFAYFSTRRCRPQAPANIVCCHYYFSSSTHHNITTLTAAAPQLLLPLLLFLFLLRSAVGLDSCLTCSEMHRSHSSHGSRPLEVSGAT